MRFGPTPVGEAEGAIVAHTLRLPDRVLKKGRFLDAGDLASLRAAGLETVTVARLEEGDVHEDEAARRVAGAIAGAGVRVEEASTGRSNLFAERPGIAVVDAAAVDRLNRVDEAITVATVTPDALVAAGEMVATCKLIPFAAPASSVERCEQLAAGAPVVRLAPLRAREVGLVLTRLPGTREALLDRVSRDMATRLSDLGSRLARQVRCEHRPEAVAAALGELLESGCAPVLLLGASAIVDRKDVIPSAVVAAGGTIERFGMPVDPGNLLLLARCGEAPVLGVPGCARSLKPSGFDWVLRRLLADLPVGAEVIGGMGAGGLLPEIAARPRPRASSTLRRPEPRAVTALVLAAGRSRRMGERNKLTADVDGVPMVGRVVDALLASSVEQVVVVVGHEAEAVREALSGRDVRFVHNPEHDEGMGASLRAGARAVDDDVDGVLVCLGDMPDLRPEHIEALIEAFDPEVGRGICQPTHDGRPGHPVLFGARHLPALRALGGDVGARAVIEANRREVARIPMADDGVVRDIDTPEALLERG